jgi:hypothetical protein
MTLFIVLVFSYAADVAVVYAITHTSTSTHLA